MHIGDITLLIPTLVMIGGAIIVLLHGVIAARRPHRGLDYYLPTQYLAPVLTAFALIWSGWVIRQSLYLVDRVQSVVVGDLVVRTGGVNLFVAGEGQAQLTVDPFAALLSFVAIAGTLVVMLLSLEHFGEDQLHKGEYYALLMFAAAAASIVAAASDLIAVYLSIEFLSLTSYVLAAFAKTDRRAGEAGLKYFLYGAASSAIMLFGMSVLFGITGGNTSFAAVGANFGAESLGTVLSGAAATAAAFVGVLFTLVGLGFKIALVPFHFWAPDVYEGAPTPVTAFLSVVSKAAGLAVLVRFLVAVAMPAEPAALSWYWILVVLTAASMFYGNLVAIPQRNIKRMLAYSSIAQVGYMMIGVLAALRAPGGDWLVGPSRAAVHWLSVQPGSDVPWGMQGVLVYVLAYLFMNLGAFAVVVSVGRRLRSDQIADYAGLMKWSPFYACALAVFLLSLAGIPPTAGFLGKFLVFGGAISAGVTGRPELAVLAVIGIINSATPVYYYFNVIRLMFFGASAQKPVEQRGVPGSFGARAAATVMLVLTLALVVFARPVSQLASAAVHASQASAVRSAR